MRYVTTRYIVTAWHHCAKTIARAMSQSQILAFTLDVSELPPLSGSRCRTGYMFLRTCCCRLQSVCIRMEEERSASLTNLVRWVHNRCLLTVVTTSSSVRARDRNSEAIDARTGDSGCHDLFRSLSRRWTMPRVRRRTMNFEMAAIDAYLCWREGDDVTFEFDRFFFFFVEDLLHREVFWNSEISWFLSMFTLREVYYYSLDNILRSSWTC